MKLEIDPLQMSTSELRNTRNMKKQGNMTPPKAHNSSKTESKDIEMVEVPPDKEFKSPVLKMVNDLKEDSNK
jgi:hypothetical protein